MNNYSIYGQFNKSGFLANRMNNFFFYIKKKQDSRRVYKYNETKHGKK